MMQPGLTTFAATGLVASAALISACAQQAGRAGFEAGAELFEEACAGCHTAAGESRTPGTMLLRGLSPRAIVASLEDGVMRVEGADLTREQRIGLAEYLTGRAYANETLPESARCADHGWQELGLDAVASMGWGGNLQATGFQPGELAGLSADDVPDLELRWAFAFPDAGEVRTRPTVIGDALLVGGPFGEVLALDAATGVRALELRGGRRRARSGAGGRGARGPGDGVFRRLSHQRLRARRGQRNRRVEVQGRLAFHLEHHGEPRPLRRPALRPRLLTGSRRRGRPPLRVLHRLRSGGRSRRDDGRCPVVSSCHSRLPGGSRNE